MNLLDTFLKRYNTTRYQLFKLTGISQNTLLNYNKKELNKFNVSFLRSLSMLTGESVVNILIELAEIEKTMTLLRGLKHC